MQTSRCSCSWRWVRRSSWTVWVWWIYKYPSKFRAQIYSSQWSKNFLFSGVQVSLKSVSDDDADEIVITQFTERSNSSRRNSERSNSSRRRRSSGVSRREKWLGEIFILIWPNKKFNKSRLITIYKWLHVSLSVCGFLLVTYLIGLTSHPAQYIERMSKS